METKELDVATGNALLTIINQLARHYWRRELQDAGGLESIWEKQLPVIMKSAYGRQSVVQLKEVYDKPLRVYGDLREVLDRRQHGLVAALDMEKAGNGQKEEIAKFAVALLNDLRMTGQAERIDRMVKVEDETGRLANVFSAIDLMCEGEEWWAGLYISVIASGPTFSDSPQALPSPTRSDDSFNGLAAISTYYTPASRTIPHRQRLQQSPLIDGSSPKTKQQRTEQQLRKKQEEVDTLTFEVEEMKELKDKHAALKKAYALLQDEKRDEKSRRERAESELETVRMEREMCRAKAVELEKAKADMLMEMKLKTAELQRVEEKVGQKEAETQKKEEEMAAMNKKYRDMVDVATAKEEENRRMEAKLNALKTKCEELEAILREMSADKERTAEIFREELRTIKERYLTESGESTQRIGGLVRELEEKTNEVETLKRRAEELKSQRDGDVMLKKSTHELQSMIDKLKKELDEKAEKMKLLEKRAEEWRRECEQMKEKETESSKENNSNGKGTYRISSHAMRQFAESCSPYEDAEVSSLAFTNSFGSCLLPSDSLSTAPSLITASQTSLLSTATANTVNTDHLRPPSAPLPPPVSFSVSPPKPFKSSTLPTSTRSLSSFSSNSHLPTRPLSTQFDRPAAKKLPMTEVDKERIKELQRRNKCTAPALRSSYPVELSNCISPSAEEQNIKQLSQKRPRQPLASHGQLQ